MNNSKLAMDSVPLSEEPRPDNKPQLREQEGRLVRILTSIKLVSESGEWSTLKIEIFDSLVNSLERDLKAEAKKETPDTNKLNRLSGQLIWADRYADLSKLENKYRVELQGIRLQLYGNTENNG